MRIMKNRSYAAVALILIMLGSSLAFGQGAPAGQGTQTTKGAVVKGKAPVNKEVLKVKLPRAEEATLKNGLHVVVLPMHKVPTFNMQLVVLSGGLADKSDFRGLSSFTATLLREGTTKRSRGRVDQAAREAGRASGRGNPARYAPRRHHGAAVPHRRFQHARVLRHQ